MAHDVIVVGGGIAGCAAAERLAGQGLNVLLLERGPLAGGATGRNQGGLLPSPLPACGGLFGEAVAFYERAERESEVPFRFRPHGYLLVAADEEGMDRARGHGHALSDAGFPAHEVGPRELRELEPGLAPDLAGAVLVEGAHALHPVLAATALAGRAARAGAEIRTHTPVRGLTTDGDRVTGVVTDDGPLPAGAVVLAAGPWSRSLAQQAGSDVPVFGARGWLLRTAPVTGAVFRHTLMQSTWHGPVGLKRNGPPLLADVAAPAPTATRVVFSLQPLPGGEVVLGSSAGPALQLDDVRDGEEAVALIAAAAARHAPVLAKTPVRAAWSGVRPMSPDGLPVVGPASGAPGLWLLTGFGIDGMPLAPGTARLLTEYLMSGHRPAAAEPFTPERFDEEG
ncbi:NAD(P)/FAD-dependent oxidoreductase [Streptomyces sp. NEAU-W12]|uniref:NAD(P)/FAD-dependent oxidoreductase n=1 Tax=Streptomyces sp. NEAU-W12 TaxID=2994668 RepID=UPI00224B82EA|nr:FAD-dependent oxidoreductase [Streptomyces sp. NEAU-W12]MCX2926907.1 FAD-dependent oxidoreductase [Streptomyces sp. NEAU-W12]